MGDRYGQCNAHYLLVEKNRRFLITFLPFLLDSSPVGRVHKQQQEEPPAQPVPHQGREKCKRAPILRLCDMFMEYKEGLEIGQGQGFVGTLVPNVLLIKTNCITLIPASLF